MVYDERKDGSNYPPGMVTDDIPGNSERDIQYDVWYESLDLFFEAREFLNQNKDAFNLMLEHVIDGDVLGDEFDSYLSDRFKGFVGEED